MEPEVVAIIPHLELETWRNITFWLTYKRWPEATGTNLTMTDILDMEVGDILWRWQYLGRVWEKEDAARKQQSRPQ